MNEMLPDLQKLNKIRDDIAKIEQNVAEYKQNKEQLFGSAQTLSLFGLMVRNSEQMLSTARTEEQRAEDAVNKKRVKYNKAIQERRAMEILREKYHAKFLKEEKKHEERENAEVIVHKSS